MSTSRCEEIETDIVQKEGENDSADKISQLSNDILQHILSSLPLKEAIATKLLSKSWGRVFPVQHFNICKRNLSAELIDSVDESLQSICKQQGSVLIFSLDTKGVKEKHAPLINKWIKVIADNNFQVLRIKFRLGRYSLPPTVFASKQLTVLSLIRCELKDDYSLSADTTARLDCLQDLSLVDVQLSETILNCLISISTSIVTFTLEWCMGIKFLCLKDLRKLEKVVVRDSCFDQYSIDRMEIEVQSLRSFEFFSRLTKDYEIDMKRCKNLEILRLVCIKIPGCFFEDLISFFPLLKSLELFGNHDSDGLEIVSVSERLTWYPQKSKVYFDLPYLINTSWFVELGEFIRKMCHNEALFLYFPAKEANVRFHQEDLRDVVFPPELSVKYLKLVFWYYGGASACSLALVDGILWSCHPETLTMKLYRGVKRQRMECLLHHLKKTGKCDEKRCKSTERKCWRHYLQDVEIKQFTSNKKIKEVPVECYEISFRFKW